MSATNSSRRGLFQKLLTLALGWLVWPKQAMSMPAVATAGDRLGDEWTITTYEYDAHDQLASVGTHKSGQVKSIDVYDTAGRLIKSTNYHS